MSMETDEQPTQAFEFDRYVDIVRRRHLPFLALLFLGWAVAWGISWILQPRFKSRTLILVEQPVMPTNYVVPNVGSGLEDRLQSLTEQILSRSRLLLIIGRMGLYSDGSNTSSSEERVSRMRKDIDVALVRDPRQNAITAFRVSYTAPDPHVAQQVTSELTNLFIDENLKVRQRQSEDTTRFLQGQLDVARSNLASQEAKVRAFQAEHMGTLPSQQGSNLQILGGLQTQLQSEQDALNSARQQLVYHQSMVDQYRAWQRGALKANGEPVGIPAMDQRLQALRSKLADLRTRYTERYPEVEELESEINRVERARAQLIASLKKEASAGGRSAEVPLEETTEAGENSPLAQLQSQLRVDHVEIAGREKAIESLKARISEYQGRLNAEPAIEQQLAELTRGYEQSQANYNDLLKKEHDSQMATRMEQMQSGQRFTIIDPPSFPVKPAFPNRLKMCGVGIGVGLALGFLAVALLEFFDDRLHRDGEIEKVLPIAIISEIPEIVTPADERYSRGRTFLGWAVTVAVVVVILAGTTISYLRA